MYGKIGYTKNALEREWIYRFSTMSKQERDSYEEGDIIEIIEPGATVVKTPLPLEYDKTKLEIDRKKQQEQERRMQRIGNPAPPDYPIKDRLLNDPSQTLDFDRNVRQKNRTCKKYLPKYRRSQVSVNIYKQNRVKGVSKGADAFNVVALPFKFLAAYRQIGEFVEYDRKKRILESQIDSQNKVVVPLKPHKIKKAIAELHRINRNLITPSDKQKVQSNLRILEGILEVHLPTDSNSSEQFQRPTDSYDKQVLEKKKVRDKKKAINQN